MRHEFLDVFLLLVVVALSAIGLWAKLSPLSAAARLVAWASRRARGPRRLVVILVSAILFTAVTEDVLWRDTDEWVLTLDRRAAVIGREMGHQPFIHEVARAISVATGAGLIGVLAVAAALLVWAGRRRAAFILLVGTAGAWLAGHAFKLVFRVSRPSSATDAISGYGFPSGHTFVTLIAVGLLLWICARRLSRRTQLALYAAGLAIAVFAGASRIILHAHWLSDVVAALALGSLYLAVTTSWSEPEPAPPIDRGHPLREPVPGTSALARQLRKRREAGSRLNR